MCSVDLSIVIPVYRSASTLRALVDRLLAVLEQSGREFEILFVDDGSPDQSWEVLRALRLDHPDCIVAIQLMRNFGQHNALMCGFRHARGRYVVTMDDDLQNPPEEIPKLLEAIESSEFDLVYGSIASKRHSGWRNTGSAIVNVFYRITFHTNVTITSFRIIRHELLESVFTYNLNFTFIDGLLAWSTQKVGEVPVAHHPRAAGRSGYNPLMLLLLAFNLFTNFSLLPLQITSMLGFVASASGLSLAVFYLVRYLLHQVVVPGYASTIVAVLVLGGMQLLALGILGEYLGRLHLNVNRKPQYIERQVLGIAGGSKGNRPDAARPVDLLAVGPSDQARR